MPSKCIAFVMNACESLEGYQRLLIRQCGKNSKNMIKDCHVSSEEIPLREELGLLLLKSKESYKHHIIFTAVNMLIDLAATHNALPFQQLVESHIRDGSFVQPLLSNDQCRLILQSCEILLESVNTLELDRVWEKNMLLSGDELKKVFHNIPPGVIIP